MRHGCLRGRVHVALGAQGSRSRAVDLAQRPFLIRIVPASSSCAERSTSFLACSSQFAGTVTTGVRVVSGASAGAMSSWTIVRAYFEWKSASSIQNAVER